MRIAKETQLGSYVKEQGVHGLFVLWGGEDYLIRRWARRLVAPFGEESFNRTVLDGQQLDLNEIYDATQQLPLFAPEKCVLVEEIDPKKLVAAELKKLEQLLEELPPETVLILTFRGGSLDGKSALGKKVVALGDKYGVVVQLDIRDSRGLTRFLEGLAKERGCSISPGLAAEMIRLVGQDMLRLESEMGKLCGYAGGGEITGEQIAAVVTPTTEERVFDLVKAILGENPQRAMEIVRGLLDLRESPVGIVAVLTMGYVDLYRAKLGQAQGANLAQVVEAFGYKGREFRLRNVFNSPLSLRQTQASLELLCRCDRGMKSSPQDPGQLLEQTVLGLLAVVKGRG